MARLSGDELVKAVAAQNNMVVTNSVDRLGPHHHGGLDKYYSSTTRT